MITFLHILEASQKTPGDVRLNGKSFTCICGENMGDNLRGSTCIITGSPSSLYEPHKVHNMALNWFMFIFISHVCT